MKTPISVDKSKEVPKGQLDFLNFLHQIESILKKARLSENPALYIYEANIRTPIFMLEGLSRLYGKTLSHHIFSQCKKRFKDLEDKLGAIDYYDGFYKEFTSQEKIPEEIINYIKNKKEEKLEELNEALKKDHWLKKRKSRIYKIIKKIEEVNWLPDYFDAGTIKLAYSKEIKKVIKIYKSSKPKFKELEAGVHEFRRELRWLSIYPQALCGLMQLSEETDVPSFLQKYLTPEILQSPFNVMPSGSQFQHHIVLNKNYFYALSWMIDALGKLKDNGLRIIILTECIEHIYKPKKNVETLALSFCDKNQMTIAQILKQSDKITKPFFEDSILKHLVNS